MDASEILKNKAHRSKQSGAKYDKRKDYERKKREKEEKEAGRAPSKHKNLKAFGVAKYGRVHRTMQRNLNRSHRKEHAVMVNRAPEVPPPVVVVVMGPPGSGKTTLIKCLVKKFTRQTIPEVKGPVTVVAGKNRRITFFECPNDLNAMIDLAKIADLALLTVDGSFGFEMETFEFLNIMQLHGFPRVMGVLTHLDGFRDGKKLRRVKKTLKQRFWVEIHQGAKLFYLSGISNGHYPKREIHNLSLYLTRLKFRPLTWRNNHSYVLADRWEDITDPATLADNPACDRTLSMFGFVRGLHFKSNTMIHIPGAGDYLVEDLMPLEDPVPLPETDPEKRKMRRSLNQKETLLYAPMSNVGGVMFDHDAMYINVHKVHFTRPDMLAAGEIDKIADQHYGEVESEESESESGESDADSGSEMDAATAMQYAKGSRANLVKSADGVSLMRGLQDVRKDLDDRLETMGLQLFPGAKPVTGREAERLFADHSDASDSKSYDSDSGNSGQSPMRMPKERLEYDVATGRNRRRAVFEDDLSEDEDDDDDFDESDEEGQEFEEELDFDSDFDVDQPEDESDDDEEFESGAQWKRGMVQKAEREFQERRKAAPNLMELVYGTKQSNNEDESDSDSDDGEFFRVRRVHNAPTSGKASNAISPRFLSFSLGALSLDDPNAEDCNYWRPTAKQVSVSDNLISDSLSSFSRSLSNDSSSDGSSSESEGGSLDEEMHPYHKTTSGEKKSASRGAGGISDISVAASVARWSDAETRERIRNRFVTGDWGASAPGAGGMDEDSDGEVYGDFEDLENAGSNSDVSALSDDEDSKSDDENGASSRLAMTAAPGDDAALSAANLKAEREKMRIDADQAERARNAALKAKKKAAFDNEYDSKKDTGEEEEEGRIGGRTAEEFEELLDFAPEVKAERQRAEVQSAINKAEFDDLPLATRMRLTGVPAGTYVRIVISGVSAEFNTNFKPTTPLLLGGLSSLEEGKSYLRTRLIRHRWHSKILKTNDPLVFSIGWRRFQSLPVYSITDDNERQRYLKYTPEHMHCTATFYGPVTPPNTGFLAFQTLGRSTTAFRVAATGNVLECDTSFRVVKKLKLTGVPMKIFKNTAFIRGMFNSALEVAKFEGVAIRTVSGVRGTIKKAVKEGPPGTFRATFEDKILLSDIVFCRTWVPVDIKKYYNPICSILDAEITDPLKRVRKPAPEGEGGLVGGVGRDEDADENASDDDDDTEKAPVLMRTLKNLRIEKGVGVVPNPDSLYTPIERPEVRKFNPLKIPKSLEAALPFSAKPKRLAAQKRPSYESKRAVVLSKEEKKVQALMHKVQAVAKEKSTKDKERRAAQRVTYEARKAKEEEASREKIKEIRKKRYRAEAMADSADKAKMMRR